MDFVTQLGKAITGLGAVVILLGVSLILGLENNNPGIGVALLGINFALVGILIRVVAGKDN